ncbi:hypothetical protein [uncultured Psychroserpens sp.]|uniref:hypothetical protein n=1 Tax=uncultured Psychroserpens sp. TaxID=255436 RepID=UPI0026109081|nr:hypothetical protein [uncultured Psychroserpens sp.]
MKLRWSFIVCLMTLTMHAQDFEGVITYKSEYPINKTALSNDELKKELGTDVTTYFKNGYYKELTNSRFISYQLFRHNDSMVYYKHNIKSDSLFYSKVNTDKKETFSYKIEKRTDTILGYICDKLIVEGGYGTKTYYYTSELSLNPEYYKNFTIGNKYDIMKLMKAIYLKLEMTYDAISVRVVATEVKKQKLENSVFDIPKHQYMIEQNM